jgi:hypothetical protein
MIFAEDKLPQVLRALVDEQAHERAALVGRRLAHQDERLVLLLACAYLAQAVDRLEVRLGQEEEHDRGGLDVTLEEDEVLEVVHVQEDLHVCWWVGGRVARARARARGRGAGGGGTAGTIDARERSE